MSFNASPTPSTKSKVLVIPIQRSPTLSNKTRTNTFITNGHNGATDNKSTVPLSDKSQQPIRINGFTDKIQQPIKSNRVTDKSQQPIKYNGITGQTQQQPVKSYEIKKPSNDKSNVKSNGKSNGESNGQIISDVNPSNYTSTDFQDSAPGKPQLNPSILKRPEGLKLQNGSPHRRDKRVSTVTIELNDPQSLTDTNSKMTVDVEYLKTPSAFLRLFAILFTIALIICFSLGKYIHADIEFLIFIAAFGLVMLIIIHVCHCIGMPTAFYRRLPTSLISVLFVFHLLWASLYIYTTIISVKIAQCDSCVRAYGCFVAASIISSILILIHVCLVLLGCVKLYRAMRVTIKRHQDQSPSTTKGICAVTNIGALPVLAQGRIEDPKNGPKTSPRPSPKSPQNLQNDRNTVDR